MRLPASERHVPESHACQERRGFAREVTAVRELALGFGAGRVRAVVAAGTGVAADFGAVRNPAS